MLEYLTAEEVAARADEIREQFEVLMNRPDFASRPKARQWSFLRHCVETLLAGKIMDSPCNKAQAIQYRFEVEDRLARYYQRPGPSLQFTFTLWHRSRAFREGVVSETYPSSNGYVLLISDHREAQSPPARPEARALLERLIADAMDAEFAVYRKLPEIDLSPLDAVFVKNGPAYIRIQHLAEQHHIKKWTISNPNNPSTRRLLQIRVIKISESEAHVRTEEYWYLRWWSILSKKNVTSYNARSFQTYILIRQNDRWLIEHNIYPPPRMYAPRRKW